jgi:hypothetical protein
MFSKLENITYSLALTKEGGVDFNHFLADKVGYSSVVGSPTTPFWGFQGYMHVPALAGDIVGGLGG